MYDDTVLFHTPLFKIDYFVLNSLGKKCFFYFFSRFSWNNLLYTKSKGTPYRKIFPNICNMLGTVSIHVLTQKGVYRPSGEVDTIMYLISVQKFKPQKYRFSGKFQYENFCDCHRCLVWAISIIKIEVNMYLSKNSWTRHLCSSKTHQDGSLWVNHA